MVKKSFLFFLFFSTGFALAFLLGFSKDWSFSSILPEKEPVHYHGLHTHICPEDSWCNPKTPFDGRWHTVISPALKKKHGSPISQIQEMHTLQGIGYAAGSLPPPPEDTNITVYDSALAYDSLNFYVSGHAPQAILMDMKGKELHRWQYDIKDLWPSFQEVDYSSYWRRAHLFENGDLLAIYECIGLIKLDKNSKLLWKHQGNEHHDLFIDSEQEQIYVLTKQEKNLPRYHPTRPVLDDLITVLDVDGKELKSVSLIEALENSYYAPLLKNSHEPDVLHTNTIEVLDGRLASRCEAFRKGNVLVSMLKIDTIAIVDLDQKKVVWAQRGMWSKQHQPTLLANGHLLLYDNEGPGDARSRILELDPLTQEVFWEYQGTYNNPFYSCECGSSERLANGNTLITESTAGRAFEVTPQKKIVWEFYSPYRAGEKQEYIASLFELMRLPQNFPLDWLKP
jgi:hypothetical protein